MLTKHGQFMPNDAAGTPKERVTREYKTRQVNESLVIDLDSVKSNPGSAFFDEQIASP
jgi:hypothetical protein